MFTIVEKSEPGILGIKIFGKPTEAEYERLSGLLQSYADTDGKVQLLISIDERLSTMDAYVFWKDFMQQLPALRDMDRLAVLGQQHWHTALERALNSQAAFQVRHFRVAEMEAAWQWLKTGNAPR